MIVVLLGVARSPAGTCLPSPGLQQANSITLAVVPITLGSGRQFAFHPGPELLPASAVTAVRAAVKFPVPL